MRLTPTALEGVLVVEIEPIEDDRGSFSRVYCAREFAATGIALETRQCNLSTNRRRGTLRGLHYQRAPMEEAKLVHCLRGAIHDVVVDLREGSPTRLRHVAVVLDATSALRMLFVPEGFAHGFQTLSDDTEVLYQMGAFYSPEHAVGLRHDDPALAIDWPLPVSALSARDAAWPLLGSG